METILVVDDEAFMLDFVRRILEAAKYRVVTATNADAGLIKELLAFAPGAKVLAMSGGGGIRFTEALRAAEAFGARASIKKPFPPNILLETVQRVLTSSN